MGLVVSFFQELDEPCDVPLKLWAIVDFSSTILQIIVGTLAHLIHSRCSDQGMRWLNLYFVTQVAFDFLWVCFGAHWIRISETCAKTSPRLFESSTVYVLSC